MNTSIAGEHAPVTAIGDNACTEQPSARSRHGLGIVGVLMIAGLSKGSGHYNLALGTIGALVGVGASISTTVAGFVSERFGFEAGFLTLAFSAL